MFKKKEYELTLALDSGETLKFRLSNIKKLTQKHLLASDLKGKSIEYKDTKPFNYLLRQTF